MKEIGPRWGASLVLPKVLVSCEILHEDCTSFKRISLIWFQLPQCTLNACEPREENRNGSYGVFILTETETNN